MSRWPKRGQCWGCRDAFLAGVQSPPLHGNVHPTKRPHGVDPHVREGRICRHGCAPRIRGERPNARPGMACSSKCERTPSGLMETCPVKPSPSLWACRARPSTGGLPSTHRPCGESPEHVAESRFSRRDAVSASGCRGRNQAQAQHDNRGQTNAWWPREHTPRSSASHPRGPAEPAPPCGPPYLAPFGDEQKDLLESFSPNREPPLDLRKS
jgi:hypothetical protein